MGWRFWKKRSVSVEVELEDDELGVAAQPARFEVDGPDFEAPRATGFSFVEAPALPPEADTDVVRSMPAAEEPVHARMERVVRLKSSARRNGADIQARGVEPVFVPSLRECALSYRLAAEEHADDPAAARDFWNAYLDLCPDDGAGWFTYGQLLLGDRRFEQAWTAFEAARRADPEDGLAAGALGFLSTARGDHVAAVAHYAEALRLRPGCRDMLQGLAEAQHAAGRTAEAAKTRAELERLQAQD